MTTFATIDENPAAPHPVLVWEQTPKGFRIVSKHDTTDELPSDIDVFRFVVPTTASPRSEGNPFDVPVVDANGCPLWKGAKVAFRGKGHRLGMPSDTGEFVDLYRTGVAHIRSDEPVDNFDFDGLYLGNSREYGARLRDDASGGLTPLFVRLSSDPRNVCAPVEALSAGMGMRR